MKLEDLKIFDQLTDSLSAPPCGGLFANQRQGRLLPLDSGRTGQTPVSETLPPRRRGGDPLSHEDQRLLPSAAHPTDHPVPLVVLYPALSQSTPSRILDDSRMIVIRLLLDGCRGMCSGGNHQTAFDR